MNESPFSLSGKTILITGASSGIGQVTAIQCSKMGARVFITARNQKRLTETLSLLTPDSGTAIISNLTSESDRLSLVDELPKLDGIVHCAGITDPVLFQFMSEERLKNIFDINYFAPVLLTKDLLKAKKIASFGSIVFIASIAGIVCSSLGGSMYSATKGAISGMVKGLALDLAPKNIRVNTICPGMIDTGIFDDSGISKEQLEEDIKKYPLKRYGKAEEVAYASIYMLSDAAKWVTGTNMIIDGGFTLL